MKILSERLKQSNLKATPQRLAIYYALYNTNKHPSAESIYKSLEPSYSTMSLATVYKTIDALKKANLIQELNVGEDCFRYDAATNPHPHLVCNHCKNVYDADNTDLIKQKAHDLKSRISLDSDFDIDFEQLYFFGTCKECKNLNLNI